MSSYSIVWSISKSAPASNTTEYQNRYGIVNIPIEWRTSNVPYSCTSYTSSSNVTNFNNNLYYKISGGSVTSITRNGNTTLDLTGATQLGFNLSSSYTRRAYVQGGAVTQTNSASCQVYITLPWGSFSTEEIITAAKLNEAASKAGVTNASATQGQLITRTPYQTVGTEKNVTFDTTKPLLSDLEALAATFPGTWVSTDSSAYSNL